MAGIEDYYLIRTNDPALENHVQTDGSLSFPNPPFDGDEGWAVGKLNGYYAAPKGKIDEEELEWLEDNNIVYYSVSFNESNQVIGGNLPKTP